MSRTEFMERLKTLLSDLEREEREEVIRYYEDYFDDAGKDQEQAVITQLESPEAVARTIKLDLQSKDTLEKGEYWENGYHNPVFEEKYELEKANQLQETNSYEKEQNQRQQKQTTTKQPKDHSKTVLIVLVCILASPFILSALGGVLGLVLGILGVVIGLFIACVALAVSLTIAGIFTFISGFGLLAVRTPTAVVMFGVGLILLAIGLLFTLLTIVIVSKFFPFLIRSISNLGNKVIYRKKVA